MTETSAIAFSRAFFTHRNEIWDEVITLFTQPDPVFTATEAGPKLIKQISLRVWFPSPNCYYRWQFIQLKLQNCEDLQFPTHLELEAEISREEWESASAIFDHIWLTEADITVLEERPVSDSYSIFKILQYLADLRRAVLEWYQLFLPYTASQIAASMTVEGSNGLSERTAENVRRAGLSHMVAISGFHIGIFIMGVRGMLRQVGMYRGGFYTSIMIGLITVYAWFVGAGASVLRASAMHILRLVSRMLQRQYEPGRALFQAAILLLLFDPYLLGSVSFQLSVGALVGILAVTQPVHEELQQPEAGDWVEQLIQLSQDVTPQGPISPPSITSFLRGFREMAVISIAAQVAILPITWRVFGTFQPISILSSTVLGAVLPLVIVVSYFFFSISLIWNIVALPKKLWEYLELILIPGTHIFARSLDEVISWFILVPGGTWELPAFSWYGAVAWWGGWYCAMKWYRSHRARQELRV